MKTWNDKRYHSLDYHLKETFGEKVYRISLNGGMTCPNRDGTIGSDGCIFCSEGGSGDFAENAALSISEQIELGKKKLQNKSNCEKFIAYFQAYTNTYAPVAYLRSIFTEAIMRDDIVVLSIATRPDCIDDEILALLEELNQIKPVWIELGLQTMHEQTADLIRRGFTLSCYENCVEQLLQNGLTVVTHIILGLPGETSEMMLKTVDYIAHSGIHGIKLQLLHVLKHTAMANMFEREPFPVFSMEEYCKLIVECIGRLPENMVIHRITGDGPRPLLLAPWWSTDKKRVLNTIQSEFRLQDTWQGKYYKGV
ncbi:MAG: TIGR01212 family radical SAM protein [Eubacterium sp.]|nr:TIGR01212 family radical SAM protein [Eubacterium sp.]